MKNRNITLIIMLVMIMSMTVPVSAAYVKAPGKVTMFSVKAASHSRIKIAWKKVKGAKGYQVQRYQNGKWVEVKKLNKRSYTDSKLKAGTKYAYRVRAYKTYKQTKWYNKKTQKWVKKKPAKKLIGKSKKVTAYKYGKWSATKTVSTAKAIKTQQNNVNNTPTSKPAHQHNHNIPIYGEKPICRQYTFVYCVEPGCGFQRRIYDDEPDAAHLVGEYGMGKHARDVRDYYTKAWKEEHEYLALSDNVDDRWRYWQEYEKFIEEVVIPQDPYWDGHMASVGIVFGVNEIIGTERGVIAYGCSCGSKHYLPAPLTIDEIIW